MISNKHLLPHKEIASKVMDGEAIMINLTNGTYYSMDSAGGFIWKLIEEGVSKEQIVESVIQHFDVTPELARADLDVLIKKLLKENLVTLAVNESSSSFNPPKRPVQPLPYQTPTLNIYRDMAELLALDPPVPGISDSLIHDSSKE